MKLIKKVNNNVALCLDSKGKEVIVTGRGVGFVHPGEEVALSRIERTFYHLGKEYISMLNDITPEAFRIANAVVDYAASRLLCELNDNLLFSLADHIDFALERYHKKMNVELPIYNDVEHLFEPEMDVGRYALRLIEKNFAIQLPKEEAARIALNLINSEYNPMRKNLQINNQVIDDITKIIERSFHISVNRHTFNYSRFVTHMYYLFKREKENHPISSKNEKLYQTLVVTYPQTNQCVNAIRAYFAETKNWILSDEECLYLILHINRLCDKEDN